MKDPSEGGNVTATYCMEYGWYRTGSSFKMYAEKLGYKFVGWVGSGSGSYTGLSNPVIITMNSPIIETANFETYSQDVLIIILLLVVIVIVFLILVVRRRSY